MSHLPYHFGVIIACHRGDYPLAKGCCASVRRYLGDVPICLFIDGEVRATELERTYGVQVVTKRDIDDSALQARSYGYGITKMLAFWHSPFERFLYLDADTVLWGNPLAGLDLEGADFICNAPHEPYTDAIVRSQYFDYDRLFDKTTRFEWRNRPLFNAGVFVARRGLFDKQEYLELVRLKFEDHDLLLCGDQGIINVLVFRGAEQGRLSVATAPLQAVVPVIPRRELEARFAVVDGSPVTSSGPPLVIHWAGAKPFTLHRGVFRRPMTHFRRRFLEDSGEATGPFTWMRLLREEWTADYRQALPPEMLVGLRGVKHASRHLTRRATT